MSSLQSAQSNKKVISLYDLQSKLIHPNLISRIALRKRILGGYRFIKKVGFIADLSYEPAVMRCWISPMKE
jgi:hypothetical protein